MSVYFGGYNLSSQLQEKLRQSFDHRFNKEVQLSEKKIGEKYAVFQINREDNVICVYENESFLMQGSFYPYVSLKNNNPKNFSELSTFIKNRENLNVLNGVFSFVYFNENSLHLIRDYPGQYPIYYKVLNQCFMFSNSYELLRSLGGDDIQIVRPGSSVEFNIDSSQLTVDDYYRPYTFKVDEDPISQMDELLYNITKQMYHMYDENEEHGVATLLSGGLDSSLITYYLTKFVKDVKSYTISGKDNKFAKLVTGELGIAHEIKSISQNEWQAAASLFPKRPYNENFYELTSSLFAPNLLLYRVIKMDGNRYIFGGSGSDELFASYNQHLMYMKDISYATRQILDDSHIFLLESLEYAARLAGVNCFSPFFARELIDFSLSLPDIFKIRNGIEKWIVRKVAEQYLPKEIAWREPGPLHVTTGSFEVINGKSYYESFYW